MYLYIYEQIFFFGIIIANWGKYNWIEEEFYFIFYCLLFFFENYFQMFLIDNNNFVKINVFYCEFINGVFNLFIVRV